ncbi:MAG: hypothetical protein EBX37_17080 [Alphaproteobacteria bacterium]|nr:hypothetical protein [Alphaproteobacteria bacterium]
MAAAITGAAFVGLKDRPGVNFFFLSAALAVVMLGAKVYLPAALLTRLALTIVFLGILKFLVF